MLRYSNSRLPTRAAPFYRCGGQRGASLVEYAFVVILFFTVIFGITGFGHALFVYHHLNNAAKEATRYAAVRGYNCNVTPASEPSCTASNSASSISGPTTTADVKAYVASITPPSIDSTKFTYNICGVSDTAACASSGPQVCTANLLNGNGTVAQTAEPDYPGCTVSVQVAYAYNFIFPLLPASSAPSPSSLCYPNTGWCMSSESQMIIVH
jgi:TadE-like protein